jgi:hypothetical protein
MVRVKKSHLPLPPIYFARFRCHCQTVKTSTTARSHDTSKDAILLTHSHRGAASEPHSLPLPIRYPHLVCLSLPLGVAALQSQRVQLAEPYVTPPSHKPDSWREPI